MEEIEYCDSENEFQHDDFWATRRECSRELSDYDALEVSQEFVNEWLADFDRKSFPDQLPYGSHPTLTIEARFSQHADKWEKETENLSSPAQIMMHPSYQAVLGMAQSNKEEIIRLMLVDLRDKRRLWFWALSFLTQDNPVTASQSGKLDAMIAAWVQWGKNKGII